jgi:hypothetical protein
MLTAPAPLIVLGDSPWLQSFDLARMSNVHTIGMGSGCRHWRTMGWYPTYLLPGSRVDPLACRCDRSAGRGAPNPPILTRRFGPRPSPRDSQQS